MKRILTIAVIAALCYGAYLFGKPYVSSYFLQRQMQYMADKADLKTNPEILEELGAFAKERGLPLKQDDFKIKRHDGRTYISVTYSQNVEVPLLKRHYEFELEVVS